jgi:hypothetical protein
MQAHQHLPLRGSSIQDIISSIRPDHIIYIRENADSPICPPPCECVDCQNQFYMTEEQKQDRFSYKTQISDVEAREILKDYISRIRNDREFLQKQCVVYGDKILSRWRKKSRQQRAACLLHAEPDLYPQQWFIPRYTNTSPEWKDARKYRKSFLLPYLNVELLKTNPAVFFGLLHNRTLYPPEDWVSFDNKELTLGWAMGYFDLEFCGHCVVMHGARYGELAPWEPKAAHRSDIIGFPRARLIIEAQACLLGFLRRVVDQILTSASPEQPVSSSKWVEMTKMGFKKGGDLAFWSQYTYQPFSAPPVFNIDTLLSQAKARLDAKGDHLWLLETEPTYMRRHIQLILQGEIIKSSERRVTYPMILGELHYDVEAYWFWQWVYDEFQNARICSLRYRDHIHAGEALPQKYDKALGALELLLVNAMHSRSLHLEAIIPQRPGFRHLWEFKNIDPTGQIRVVRKSTTDITDLFYEDPLEWCLIQLQGAPDAQTRFDHAMLFNFLDEHLSSCSAKDRARLDPIIFEKLSDYAAIHELLVSVRLHRPQNTNRDLDDVFENDDRKVWRHRNKHPKLTVPDYLVLAELLEEFAEIPLPKGRKDRGWLQRFDSIHRALQKFWEGMRQRYQASLERDGRSFDEIQSDLDILSLCTSSIYLEGIQAERESIMASITNIEESIENTSPQIHYSPNESQKAVRQQNVVAKVKVKTRGTDPIALTGLPEAKQELPPKEVNPIVLVKARTFEILNAMFPAANEETAKSMDWNAFVQAMGDVGFLAWNGGGSAVIFEKSSDSGQGGRIIFHKPHPVEKIDPIMFRSMGKRMTKWFGWHRDLFVLETPK